VPAPHISGWIAHRLIVPDMLDALVERNATTKAEHQHRDDQARKVNRLALPERVFWRSGDAGLG